ncbi:MAG: hypothetical protein DHS20C18_23600 [Saprospiraceae bacterium]|nr:MAG: hypothetical protein DHS20C18_23600 [Saprospiraceae bacterium]
MSAIQPFQNHLSFLQRTFFFILFTSFILLTGCPKVPIEDSPGAGFRAYPLVEIQVNNSETTVDDYVYSTRVDCRARLVNHSAFSSAVSVRVRNFNLPSDPGPRVDFRSPLTTTFGSVAFLDLPADGSWAGFEVQGNSANVSSRDKDVVIEMVENRVAAASDKNVVLARKALMVTNSPLPAVTPQIDLHINGSSYTIDDYVTWSPTFCDIRIVNHASFSSPLSIRLRNYSSSVGKVRFATEAMIQPTTHATLTDVTVFRTPTDAELTLSLPDDGTAARFYIAGEFTSSGGPRPSEKDKDAVIEVFDPSSGDIYGRWALMVRIRKNANNITTEERERFLNAMVRLNETFEAFDPYVGIHADGASINHFFCLNFTCSSNRSAPSFLPWHRALILRIEQDLQAIEPSAALHYWKYDEPAPNVFHPDFMGRYDASLTPPINISMSNPLSTWNTTSGPNISRGPSYNDQTGRPTIFTDIDHFSSMGSSVTTFQLFRQILEGTSHADAHNNTGSTNGWIGDFFRSPNDPLFYMLHSNVDRIWAKWQSRGAGRYEPERTAAFSPQGSFPSPASGSVHIGGYVMDPMWPWNGTSGTGTNNIDDYPTSSYPSFPITPGNFLMVPVQPRPYDMIDYRISRIAPVIDPFPNRGIGCDYLDTEIFVFNPSL